MSYTKIDRRQMARACAGKVIAPMPPSARRPRGLSALRADITMARAKVQACAALLSAERARGHYDDRTRKAEAEREAAGDALRSALTTYRLARSVSAHVRRNERLADLALTTTHRARAEAQP